MRDGTRFFLDRMASLADDEIHTPSALPGWSRAHVIAHVARNAEALHRLLEWARTGVETPMYESAQQRDDDIETTSRRDAATLRADATATAEVLDTAVESLPPPAWRAPVRSARGRQMAAADVPWMRVREVWLHAIDLGAGADVAQLPPAVVDTMLDDVTEMFDQRADGPSLLLQPDDRDRTWTVHSGQDVEPTKGTAAELLGWLTGRAPGTGLSGARPQLPAWL
jgi:maleylpyruvate isomerase